MYSSVIGTRYKAPELTKLWSQENKIILMRKLWISLAKNQHKLGVTEISEEGIKQMEDNILNIDYNKIEFYENKYKHDIMAYLQAYNDICPLVTFIHLGTTSNYINDNADIILIRDSLLIINNLLNKLFNIIKEKSFEYKDLPTIGYTHLQNGQLTTVGKRFTLWNSDIKLDLENLDNVLKKLPFRGVKGTVGSEDSILKIFNGDKEKCKELNNLIANEFNFKESIIITGQTYSRKYDVMIFQAISNICQSIYKMMNDIRLLSSKNEIYEEFNKEQIGSSAMPYKINPITCEKICSLTRYIINNENNINQTYINQWLERSLDDSAIKRIIYPESLLLLEYILNETINTISKLYINVEYINEKVHNYMPFIISESIIINGVKMGYNRNDIHYRLMNIMKKINNNINIKFDDEIINNIINNSNISLDPINYIGKCCYQIEDFYN